jgi:hypothetical protein
VALLALAACGRSDDRSGVVVRDSAGIRIVESSAPLLSSTSGWAIAPTPALEIGANEQDSTQNLNDVAGALRLSDGRIVVANGAAPVVRWYDSTGAFLHGTGRYGQGPGEFDSGEGSAWVYALWPLAGDSVATWEHPRRRMYVYDPAGRYVRAVVIDLPPNMDEMSWPQAAGLMGGGVLAYVSDRPPSDQPLGELRRDSLSFVHFHPDGKFAREIARRPGWVRFMVERRTGGRTIRGRVAQPFAPVFAAWTQGALFYYGSADRHEIAVFDTTGALRTLIRRSLPRQPVTKDAIDRFVENRLASLGNTPDRRRQAEEDLKAIPFPDSFPAYRNFRVDREGVLWVQAYVPTGSATSVTWSTFDREGRWITDIQLPAAWQITDIGRDYIVAVETNELDVEQVRTYRLRRGSD